MHRQHNFIDIHYMASNVMINSVNLTGRFPVKLLRSPICWLKLDFFDEFDTFPHFQILKIAYYLRYIYENIC